MFQIIKEVYACSLAPGVKIPSYCKDIQPDCSCITTDGRVIPVDSWGSVNTENIASVFIPFFKNPIFLGILLISLLLSFFSTYFIFNQFLNKKITGVLATAVKVFLCFILVIIYFLLLFFLWINIFINL